jgi:hypothetical protein
VDSLRARRPNEPSPTTWYDYTKLSAINVCPTWGVVRYGLGKTPTTTSRAMALEAGRACHDVFAAVRIVDRLEDTVEPLTPAGVTAVHSHAGKLFGESRWQHAYSYVRNADGHPANNNDFRTRAQQCVLTVLNTSGYVDNPDDRRRSLTRLEEACILYMDKYEWGRWMPVWLADGRLSVEIGFDLVATRDTGSQTISFNLLGRIDAIVRDRVHNDEVQVHENKTASRIDEAWQSSFAMNNQITTYALAAEALVGTKIDYQRVFGLCIPVPKQSDYGGYIELTETRTPTQRSEWFDWAWESVAQYERWLPRPHLAPHYTHSCTRYFRPCPLVGLCVLDPQERVTALGDMTVERWHPLEQAHE